MEHFIRRSCDRFYAKKLSPIFIQDPSTDVFSGVPQHFQNSDFSRLFSMAASALKQFFIEPTSPTKHLSMQIGNRCCKTLPKYHERGSLVKDLEMSLVSLCPIYIFSSFPRVVFSLQSCTCLSECSFKLIIWRCTFKFQESANFTVNLSQVIVTSLIFFPIATVRKNQILKRPDEQYAFKWHISLQWFEMSTKKKQIANLTCEKNLF